MISNESTWSPSGYRRSVRITRLATRLSKLSHRGCVYNVPRSGPFSTRAVRHGTVFSSFLLLVRHSPLALPRGIRVTLRFRSLGEQLPRSRPLFLIFADPIFSKYLLSVFRSRRYRARKEMEQRWEILITPLQGSCVRGWEGGWEGKQKPCRFRSRDRYPTRVATRVRESTRRDERPYRRIFLYFGYFLKYTQKRERERERKREHSIIRATRPRPL